MANDIIEPKSKSLMAAQQDYIKSIAKGLNQMLGDITKYQCVCGYNILAQINVILTKDGLNFTSPEVDKETINNAIKYAIVYQLNTDNREVFVITRNEKRGDKRLKVVEVKPQYRGVLKILSTYGRDVKKVYPEWIVREGDDFKYPTFKGLEIIPPEWTPKGQEGKIVRVVVPIQYKDGTIDFRIAERESVATNIKAQIKQSVMYDSKKAEILAKIQDMTLDELLSDKTIASYVNETYTGLSRDEMLITKLVLNAVKRVQIDYSSALARELNEKTFDNADVYRPHHNAAAILEQSNAPLLDLQEVEVEEEPKKAKVEVDEDGVVDKEAMAKAEALAKEAPRKKSDEDFYSLFDDFPEDE